MLQGIIKLWNNGEFYIANEGRRCIFVDGRPVSVCVFVTTLTKQVFAHLARQANF